MKVLVVSESLPPVRNGQSLVLYRLLRDKDPADYCLASQYNWVAGPGKSPPPEQLPGRYYNLALPKQLNRGHRWGLVHLREGINVRVVIADRARQLADIIKREACDVVVGCTGDVADLPAVLSASRRSGVPFFAYIFDHYVYREWQYPSRRWWARHFEPKLMKEAARVIVPNEILQDDLRERFGIEPVLIHNSLDISLYQVNGRPLASAQNNETKIVYTGDVYEAHYDAFRNLMAAIELLARPEIKLHLYTDRSLEELAACGISGPIVRHSQRSPDEMPRIQMEADILFLPLAFHSPYPNLVRTSATTKLGEYLAARRPVIVHAPPDCFPAAYFRQHDCGMVVDRLDPSLLAQKISQVLDDATLAERLVARAWEQAWKDFHIAVARATFWNLLTEATGGGDRI
jgi:glycosyltransferase involved in cell wall biosynthesis